MAMIDWDKKFLIDVEQIDKQHQNLVELVNHMYEYMKVGKGQEILEKVIKELLNYAKYHFADEELIMLENDYPEYDEHFEEHNKFIEKVENVYENFCSGKIGLTSDLLDFLKKWLTNHILITDKALGYYLQEGDEVEEVNF